MLLRQKRLAREIRKGVWEAEEREALKKKEDEIRRIRSSLAKSRSRFTESKLTYRRKGDGREVHEDSETLSLKKNVYTSFYEDLLQKQNFDTKSIQPIKNTEKDLQFQGPSISNYNNDYIPVSPILSSKNQCQGSYNDEIAEVIDEYEDVNSSTFLQIEKLLILVFLTLSTGLLYCVASNYYFDIAFIESWVSFMAVSSILIASISAITIISKLVDTSRDSKLIMTILLAVISWGMHVFGDVSLYLCLFSFGSVCIGFIAFNDLQQKRVMFQKIKSAARAGDNNSETATFSFDEFDRIFSATEDWMHIHMNINHDVQVIENSRSRETETKSSLLCLSEVKNFVLGMKQADLQEQKNEISVKEKLDTAYLLFLNEMILKFGHCINQECEYILDATRFKDKKKYDICDEMRSIPRYVCNICSTLSTTVSQT